MTTIGALKGRKKTDVGLIKKGGGGLLGSQNKTILAVSIVESIISRMPI